MLFLAVEGDEENKSAQKNDKNGQTRGNIYTKPKGQQSVVHTTLHVLDVARTRTENKFLYAKTDPNLTGFTPFEVIFYTNLQVNVNNTLSKFIPTNKL